MNRFKHLVYELEDYARQNGGRFWLADVPSRSSPPPAGQLWIVVDFDEGQTQASVFVDIVCAKHRFPVLVFQATDLEEEFKQEILRNALVLSGPPYGPATDSISEGPIDEN